VKEWNGIVEKISSRDFNGTKLWSFQLEECPRYFRTGKTEPQFMEGACVTFTERNGQVDPATVSLTTDASAPTTSKSAPTQTELSVPAGAGAPPETAPATSVGERIRYQAARADAARLVVAALHTDHLPHAANIAKNKRLDLVLGYVEQVTLALLEQENNNG
jgi:hypothetical protein